MNAAQLAAIGIRFLSVYAAWMGLHSMRNATYLYAYLNDYGKPTWLLPDQKFLDDPFEGGRDAWQTHLTYGLAGFVIAALLWYFSSTLATLFTKGLPEKPTPQTTDSPEKPIQPVFESQAELNIARNGESLGEWTKEQVRRLYKDGKLLPTDHYWKEGMPEWLELSTLIRPDEDAPQEMKEPLFDVGIGRLVYIGVVLPVLLCLSFTKSVVASSYTYDRETAGMIEIFVGIVALGVILCAVFLRLKNIGNSTTMSVVFTALAAVPLLGVPVTLYCLFCPAGHVSKPEIKTSSQPGSP